MGRLVTIYKVLGVDQSINSTGICLHTLETVYPARGICSEESHEHTQHSYQYWILASKLTKKQKEFSNPFVVIDGYEKRNGTDYISKEVAKTHNIYDIVDYIEKIVQVEKPDMLCLEGISYGSVGSAALVDLAGLNYCIRMMAIRRGLKISIASPTSLKSFATGNGGALKEEMVWAWKQCDHNIKNIGSDIKIDDLADAFFLSRYPVQK